MAVKFILMMALIVVGSADPDPDQSIQIDVKQQVNAAAGGCGGGGCCDTNSCPFDGTVYSSGSILEEACIYFLCNNGQWEYTEKYNHHCGKCAFGGDPHVVTYDPVKWAGNPNQAVYLFMKNGSYIMSQPGFGIPAEFYVTGHFTHDNCTEPNSYDDICRKQCGDNNEGPNCPAFCIVSCVDGATYHEPGISVSLVLPHMDLNATCQGANTDTDPKCAIKVFVNGKKRTIGNSVKIFYGTDGAILVFKHKYIGEASGILNDGKVDLNCMNIVGTKGFSLVVCERYDDYPWSYLFATPSLKTTTSTLYGLCNTYTGNTADDYIAQNGSEIPYTADIWGYISDDFPESWEV